MEKRPFLTEEQAQEIIQDVPTPFHVYDEKGIRETARRVQAAFSQMAGGRTVIMIAHRLSTVAGADRIYVLRDGKTAESGSFKELTERGGLFSEMWSEYERAAQWKVEKEG